MAIKLRKPGTRYLEGSDIAPSNMSKFEVEAYAEKVANVTDFEVGGDLSELVRVLGGNLHLQDMEDWVGESGSIFVHDRCKFDILLSRYTSPLRDRFTIAHELGHYFLHSNQGKKPLIAYRYGSTRIEWEANWFAASLLMPAGKFKQEISRSSLEDVALRFEVSIDAARIRAHSISK